ncbi:MAG: RNB domain-containing ribonuclease, partial [Deltaproteobacteria bacterium]|nr:RNB domain-containing ribonuclease [Deltaproteobacteria bacterium]
EQISLLCNIEGAKFLEAGLDHDLKLAGIFRLHDAPSSERLDELASFIETTVRAHSRDGETWHWRREQGESLADYVARLPTDDKSRRLAQAIQRQAMVSARPSYFATEPGPHYGIGARAYSRFSAPMRELVGIITHHFALAQLRGSSVADAGLAKREVEEAVTTANRAKELQKRAGKAATHLALDQLFAHELDRPLASRSRWLGTIMGVTPKKVYVQLDDPPVDVKLYVDDLEAAGSPVECTVDGSLCRVGGQQLVSGAAVELVVRAREDGRWLLAPS